MIWFFESVTVPMWVLYIATAAVFYAAARGAQAIVRLIRDLRFNARMRAAGGWYRNDDGSWSPDP